MTNREASSNNSNRETRCPPAKASRSEVAAADPRSESVSEPGRLTFRKAQRVKSPRDFTAAMNGVRPAADGTLVVFLRRRGDDGPARLGVTVPKRTGDAPTRNRWKRWIRESFRRRQDDMPRGYDVIVRPKKGSAGGWDAVDQSLHRMVARALDRMTR